VHLSGVKKMEIGGCSIGSVGRIRENKFKVQITAGKVTVSIFWDSEGMLLMEFLKRGATINSEPCVQTSKKLNQWI
jgi:hypothetical protein